MCFLSVFNYQLSALPDQRRAVPTIISTTKSERPVKRWTTRTRNYVCMIQMPIEISHEPFPTTRLDCTPSTVEMRVTLGINQKVTAKL